MQSVHPHYTNTCGQRLSSAHILCTKHVAARYCEKLSPLLAKQALHCWIGAEIKGELEHLLNHSVIKCIYLMIQGESMSSNFLLSARSILDCLDHE